MGLADAFGSEDRVDVKYSDFYKMVKGCTERDILLNGVKTETPYEYMLQMITGEKQKSESGESDGATED